MSRWDKDRERERKAAYRARKRAEVESSAKPERPSWEAEPVVEERQEAVKELVIESALSEVEEQAIRDRFDYTSSETRSKAERDAAAERMLRKAGLEARGVTEESYVQEQLALTREYVKQLKPLVRAPQDPPSVVDKTSPQAVEERLRRAEKHARWRYRGFVEGEIASL
jgi:hypothetical protein